MKKKVFIYEEEFKRFVSEISIKENAKEEAIKEKVSNELFELKKPNGFYGITTLSDTGKEEKFLLEYKAESEGRGTSEEE